jgi:hypothetical protein
MRVQTIRGLTPALLCLAILPAQDYRGSILGRVTDTSGAIVPNVRVGAVNEATNVPSSTLSNAEGNFLVSLLDPGTYTVTVEAAGFKKLVRSGIEVRTGDKLTLDFQLEVGATSESVTVSGAAPLLETNSANLGQVISHRFLDQLYVANRNPLGLASLMPGVTGGGGTMASDGQIDTISMNGGGGTTGNNEVVVDGASVIVPRQYGDITTSPSVDAVEEVRIQSTMFDAAYGHSTGGLISYATRGGTNQLHGSFEDFYRNKIFDANKWFNNRSGLPRGSDSLTLWSGVVGGPIYIPRLYDGRNRTFFFTSVEYTSTTSPTAYSAEVPTALERQGDFSKTLSTQGGPLTIYNPYTTAVNGTNVTRQPFPGNQIPASMFNSTGATIIKSYPAANISGAVSQLGVYNWVVAGATSVPQKQITERIDRVISEKQRLFGRFGFIDYLTVFDSVPRGLYSAPIGGSPNGDYRHIWNFSLAHDYLFSPTLILETRFNVSRYWSDTWYSGNGLDPTELGIPDAVITSQMRRGWPQINLGSSFFEYGVRFKTRANDSYNLNGTLTKTAGAHSIRFGGEARLVRWNENSPGTDASGAFAFSSTFTQSNPLVASAAQTSGTSLASLLLGIPASGDISGPAPSALHSMYYAGFVQDDWKITPRLTLNIGVRYELEMPYSERHNYIYYGFNYSSPSPIQAPGLNLRGYPLFGCVAGNPCREGNIDGNNFGPRFGFAWQARPGTVLRGGYGLFYEGNLANQGTSTDIPSTFSTNYTYIGTQDSGETPFTNISNPFPNGLLKPVGSSQGSASLIGQSVTFLNQARVLPYTQQMQFGIQQSLPSQTRLEVAFVRQVNVKGFDATGNNTEAVLNFNLNELPASYLARGVEQSLQVTNPFYGIAPVTTSLGSSKTIAQKQLWLAYPQFTGVTGAFNGVNAQYQRLQFGLEKRLSHGFSVLFNWSISKLMQNNIVSTVNAQENIRGISQIDTPHIVNLAFVYDLPFGPGRPLVAGRGPLGHIIGGWTLSGITTYALGQPLSVTDTNGRPIPVSSPALSGAIEKRIGDQVDPVTHQVVNPYFKTTVWQSLPDQYTLTPEPLYLGYLRSPASKGVSASLIKRVQVRDRLHISMRLDASGLFNTPQWAAPGTNLANKATFGVINSAGGNRKMQVALRAQF